MQRGMYVVLSCAVAAVLACQVCAASNVHGAGSKRGPGGDTGLRVAEDAFVQADQGFQRIEDLGIERVVFATRLSYDDPHWYANIGYYCDDRDKKAYAGNGKPDQSKLYLLDVRSREVRVLFDAEGGGVRDPAVHYDGRTVLFAYRSAGCDWYNLYEIQADGSGLRQVTRGPWDDYEAAYLPDGDIVFVSTRSQRWVGCWKTQVGTLFRCNRRGGDIRPISYNLEHDNTPAVLPDGRIVFTRWEYVDRSQVGYHQLWTMSPDGANVATYFGNQQHYPLFIDAKPIPGTEELLLIDSPGHGRSDHRGFVCTIAAKYGPDDERGYHRITPRPTFNDPAPIDSDNFVVASGKRILIGNRSGDLAPVVTYKGEANVHEPVLLRERPRERILAEQTDDTQPTGRMVLTDIYEGRNMEGIERGQIKKLLVLEALPKPVNFSGGMDLTSWLGTFMLERVLGTVPVEADGSAYFEVPAGRTVFFVALDANDMSVKRMQSFTNVVPGETLGCVGCHEHRVRTPDTKIARNLAATQRPASNIKPFAGMPDVLDFRRDVQPVLDEHCVRCHSYERPEGGLVLTDDLGPRWSISYFTLLASEQVADGRNGLGNQKPRTIGSCASGLMEKISGSHYDVTVSGDQWRTVWMWIESGAPYAGTYAALRNQQDQQGEGPLHAGLWSPVLNQRCRKCHAAGKEAPALPSHLSEEQRRRMRKTMHIAPHERIVQDTDSRFSAHVLLNMSRPELTPLLLAPLAEEAGGWGTCLDRFESKDDPDYKRLFEDLHKGAGRLRENPIYGTAGFKPNHQYVREMKRFGVLEADFDARSDAIDWFRTDQEYWEQFWYEPQREEPWPYLR